MDDQRGIIEKDQPVVSINPDEKVSESSSSSTMAVNEAVLQESVIMVSSNSSKQTDESISIDDKKKAKGVLDGNLVGKEELNDKRVSSCAIDVKLGDDDDGREMVCRICHLGCDQSPERVRGVTSVDGKMKESVLVQLGCGCKDELGVAHAHCAEAWFKLKGNRVCEICGEGARNIRGIIQEQQQMAVEWNDRGSYASHSPERNGVWWRGQPCCNFLMACLIVAFVLPWFFRVKIM